MKILELKIDGYRNLEKNHLFFSPGINFIYGQNAQGKTNLIEAIWMFTGARSFRGTKDLNLVNFKKESAKLEGKFFFEKREQEISVFFGNGRRKVFLNGVAKAYPTNIIGKLRVVVFSPSQISLVSAGPESRRKFLDAAICQLKPTYISKLLRYNQILRSRNAVLKDICLQEKKGEIPNFDFLDIWDEKLSETGAEIVKERLNYLKELKKEACQIYCDISEKKEEFEVKYISSFCKNTQAECLEIKDEFKAKLEKSHLKDLKIGSTNFGPHKDDIDIFVDEKRVKFFGSQGQIRSAALSLKLAEAEILEKNIGESPLVLLDDVMSELDDSRKNYMISKIKNKQVFITNCDHSFFDKIKKNGMEGKLFEVSGGKISQENNF